MQIGLEPVELWVGALERAATVRLRAEGEMAEALFEVVGGAGRFALDAGDRAELPLRDGERCVMTVSRAEVAGSNDAHGEIVARGTRNGVSLPVRPSRVLVWQARAARRQIAFFEPGCGEEAVERPGLGRGGAFRRGRQGLLGVVCDR